MLLDDRLAEALWFEHMRRGDFEAAWRISDEILRSGDPVPTSPTRPPPVWSGEPVDGRSVVIRCHHGLGDTLQFIRYAPLVRARARRVLVAPQPELVPLIGMVPGVDALVAEGDPLEFGHRSATDSASGLVEVEVMELPYVFRTTLDTIPATVPYLHVESGKRGSAGTQRLAVGLVWRAGAWQPERSIDVRLLAPLANIPGVEIHVLQRNARREELRTLWRGGGRDERNAGNVIDSSTPNVLELARLIRSLDLVIGVDTMVIHLAGALGVPVWAMLRARADWRWMDGRDDSPWYPTMRLFRQEREGEWRPVVERVASELQTLVGGFR